MTTAKQKIYDGFYALVNSSQVSGIDIWRAISNISGITAIEEVKISLSAEVLKGIASGPFILIDSQGAGTAIQVVSATARVNYGTEVFDTGADLSIAPLGQLVPQFKCPGILQATHDGLWVFSPLATADTHEDALEIDSPLVIFDPTGTDSTDGDSTIDIYLSYKVITL
jgi:hypothetical protein